MVKVESRVWYIKVKLLGQNLFEMTAVLAKYLQLAKSLQLFLHF